MIYMKNKSNFILLSLFIIFIGIIDAQMKTSNKKISINENLIDDFKQPIIQSNKFSMNQSFSMSTSIGNDLALSNSIFSNFTNHELSEKLNLKTGLHLLYGNNFSFPSKSNMEYSYEIALDYKINANTFFNITLLKHSNQNNLKPFDSFRYETK